MVRKLPKITYKVRGLGKRRCTVDFRLEELRCKKGKTPSEGFETIKFVDMPDGKYSKVKKKLRGLRSRTSTLDYIRGLDD